MAMTPKQMTDHVLELAEKHDVRIVFLPMDLGHSVANATAREVYVPPITDGAVYAAVLHELGHVVHPRGVLQLRQGAPIEVVLREERNAWAWARYMAKEWTPLMEESERHAMSTYLRREQAEKHRAGSLQEIITIMDAITKVLDASRKPLTANNIVVTKPGRKP